MKKIMFYFDNIIGTIYDGAYYVVHHFEDKVRNAAILYSNFENNKNIVKTKKRK